MADQQAILKTNQGDITINLFPNHAPETVSNFTGLAQGTKDYDAGTDRTGPFYDGLTFHRVIPGFMIQGGCPLGTGTGGPGYTFKDEPHPELVFDKPYLLAMANAGPGTNGSQFFITVGATPWLNRKHTIFGEVADQASRDVVDAIAATRTGRGRPPGRAGGHRVGRGRRVLSAQPPDGTPATPGDRGADLLPAPRPGVVHPLPAVRADDLPRLHARRRGGLPVPVVRRGGREGDPQRTHGVRRPPLRQPRPHLAGADRHQRGGVAGDRRSPAAARARWPTARAAGAQPVRPGRAARHLHRRPDRADLPAGPRRHLGHRRR